MYMREYIGMMTAYLILLLKIINAQFSLDKNHFGQFIKSKQKICFIQKYVIMFVSKEHPNYTTHHLMYICSATNLLISSHDKMTGKDAEYII